MTVCAPRKSCVSDGKPQLKLSWQLLLQVNLVYLLGNPLTSFLNDKNMFSPHKIKKRWIETTPSENLYFS